MSLKFSRDFRKVGGCCRVAESCPEIRFRSISPGSRASALVAAWCVMGLCKSRALSQVYMVGMEPDRYFDLRIADSHKIMFQSVNSEAILLGCCFLLRTHSFTNSDPRSSKASFSHVCHD